LTMSGSAATTSTRESGRHSHHLRGGFGIARVVRRFVLSVRNRGLGLLSEGRQISGNCQNDDESTQAREERHGDFPKRLDELFFSDSDMVASHPWTGSALAKT